MGSTEYAQPVKGGPVSSFVLLPGLLVVPIPFPSTEEGIGGKLSPFIPSAKHGASSGSVKPGSV